MHDGMQADSYSGGSSGEESGSSWVEWFQSLRGNELFCSVDEDYITDRFNLTGLNTVVQHYQLAYEIITDSLGQELDPEVWDAAERSARHLYGLIHARYILSNKGLCKMAEKMKRGDFGKCPRVLCHNQNVIPVGISDNTGVKCVKLYCPKCEDIYNPPSKRHLAIDGAFFTASLPHLLLQMFPNLMPQKSAERYIPTIFGFKVHAIANEHRKQDRVRQDLEAKLQMNPFEE
jgi:casein kinase II subunit beta